MGTDVVQMKKKDVDINRVIIREYICNIAKDCVYGRVGFEDEDPPGWDRECSREINSIRRVLEDALLEGFTFSIVGDKNRDDYASAFTPHNFWIDESIKFLMGLDASGTDQQQDHGFQKLPDVDLLDYAARYPLRTPPPIW